MKNNPQIDRIKRMLYRVERLLKKRPKTPDSKMKSTQERATSGMATPQSIAFQLFGTKTRFFLPFFSDLDVKLKSASVKVNLKAYISLTVFTSILALATAMVSVPLVLLFAFSVPALAAVLFGIGGGLFAVAFTTIAFYGYPIYRADTMKRQLEDELPFTTGYMAILTSAGVSPENVINSLSSMPAPLATSSTAKEIMTNVKLFGADIITALEEASKRTPSEPFQEMIEGFISTIHSGGNLASYLRGKSTQYMKLKRIGLKRYADTLSMLSEFYVAILLTGPLMLIIMLTVMAMLGGGNLGILSPDLMLSLLTYLGIPLGATVFLIILDATSPKW